MRIISASQVVVAVTTLVLPAIAASSSIIPSVKGLTIEKTNVVKCSRKTHPGDKLSVAYRGVLADGTEFDSSKDGPPFTFTLGKGEVIKGWDFGLVDMCIGESRKITIAPELAYGDRQMEIIPPGSTLIFDTTLEAIEGVEKEEQKAEPKEVKGLKIEVTQARECPRKSRKGDIIFVEYRGTLTDGTEFDRSDRGPFHFTLGKGQVIAGWDLGLLDMCVGESRKLTLAPEMGYGDSAVPGIPVRSTLIFETKLVAIAGVEQDMGETPVGEALAGALGHDKPPKDDEPSNGECRLLGPFAILIQGALGTLALLALVLKRYREQPRRPVKIWFFDVSKQLMGSAMLHVANLLLSMLFSGDFDVKNIVGPMSIVAATKQGDQPNPCSFYLLNLAIDTTIGIPILVVLLRVIHILASYTPLAKPLESLKTGHYGRPPRVTWWLKQSFLYFIGLFCMKVCVFILFQLLPWLGWVGDWALRWTEGNEALQIAFVMLVFPLIMNVLQYWIIDSFIKDSAGGWQDSDSDRGTDEDEEHRGLMAGDGRRDSQDGEDAVIRNTSIEDKSLKAANATPVPAYSVDDHSTGSSSFGSRKLDPTDDEDEVAYKKK